MVLNTDNHTSPLRLQLPLGYGKLMLCPEAGWEQLPAVFPTESQRILGSELLLGLSVFLAHVCCLCLSLLNSAHTSLFLPSPRLCPRHRPCPRGAPRLVWKWAGGPLQGWEGQAQIQGWLC